MMARAQSPSCSSCSNTERRWNSQWNDLSKIIKKFTVEIGEKLRLLLLVVEFEEAIGNGYLCVEAARPYCCSRKDAALNRTRTRSNDRYAGFWTGTGPRLRRCFPPGFLGTGLLAGEGPCGTGTAGASGKFPVAPCREEHQSRNAGTASVEFAALLRSRRNRQSEGVLSSAARIGADPHL